MASAPVLDTEFKAIFSNSNRRSSCPTTLHKPSRAEQIAAWQAIKDQSPLELVKAATPPLTWFVCGSLQPEYTRPSAPEPTLKASTTGSQERANT